jgi:tetratricopeptide (TPR) repeat protein|tara:strand:- start:6044 stop:7042 length:999 start_codon:yes stop_codon:yes gene_type:complete
VARFKFRRLSEVHVFRSIVFPAAVALALGTGSLAVHANAVADAQKMMQRGDYAAALSALDAQLRSNPQDAEARFVRGLALTQLDRVPDAIRAFADLTRDYPQLPEPYNNLAVLYAQEGDYEKARDALEAALATHPSYATAHENLGDIYAALAGAAYNRALMLDQGNRGVQQKLSLISQMDGAPATAAAAPAAPVAAPQPAAQPATQPPAAAAVPPPAAAPFDTAPIQSAVNTWAQAWQNQDLPAYFFAYARNFTPEGGLSRSAWETQRRDRISRPETITLRISNLQVQSVPGGAIATFTQDYSADTYSDSVTKVLEMVREDGNWKITREFTR